MRQFGAQRTGDQKNHFRRVLGVDRRSIGLVTAGPSLNLALLA